MMSRRSLGSSALVALLLASLALPNAHGGPIDMVTVGNPGNANDTNMNSGAASLYHFVLYTGTGATDAGAALVSNGNPPDIGYFTDMGVTNGFIFCDTSAGGGKLRIYNGSGAVFYTPTVFVYATQDLGKR